MALTDQDRIATERRHPWIVDLWFALQPLKSVVSFMNTGAHPDDETTAMLAALGVRDGIGLSFACANRGEGGQNDIGTEAGADLGAVRTREMERAAEYLGMRLYWLSEHSGDAIYDFGFSKSGVETLAKWGHARTLELFVEIIRTERPDIICPTFLDVPGQHGHHRAMTQAAHEVMGLAADPAFGCDLPVWQVKKLYLPAWGGGGGSYDDEVPPPPATLVVEAKGSDPVTGWSYEHIAQHSRAYHKTQGMGRWWPLGEERDWPLHLAESHVAGPDETVFSGLPRTLADLGLAEAQAAVDAAIAAFPDGAVVAREAARAYGLLDAASVGDEAAHKVAQKRLELARVVRIASRCRVRAELDRDTVYQGANEGISLEIVSDAPGAVVWPEAWRVLDGDLQIGAGAALTDPYRSVFDPLRPEAPFLRVDVTIGDQVIASDVAFVQEPVVLPAKSAAFLDDKVLINRQTGRRQFELALADLRPAGAVPSLDLPAGWRAEQTGSGFAVTLPDGVSEGLVTLPLRLDGDPAQTVRRMAHAHINPTARITPTQVSVRVLDVAVPDVRVGYIGGGNDRVAHWLAALGADVTELGDADLTPAGLARFDTILIGIFALRFRAGLVDVMPMLHDWTRAGGNLVTLYHRPWDNWDPATIPPAPLEIGQPSLRWRVTDETAAVTHLRPDHPLLTTPNRIDAEDWVGWHKERGLYFAKSWDDAYTPLLEMADPDEAPHQGALLAAKIGRGQHVHTSLILHHQMEHLVPGAFRLMANLIGKPG